MYVIFRVRLHSKECCGDQFPSWVCICINHLTILKKQSLKKRT